MLFGPYNVFCTFTSALPAVCVQCTMWLLFAGHAFLLLRYCLSDSEMVPVVPVIIIIQYVCLLSQAFLPGNSLEPAVIPTAHASSFTLQYFPYYV